MTTTAMPGCPVDESFDPLSPESLADPYAVLAGLPGDGAPIFFAPSIGYYVVTRYQDVEEVFRDPAAYSAAVAQAPLVPITPQAQQILLAGGHRPRRPWSAWTNLGRLEAQIAIAELARRYPNLALAPDQEFTFPPNISFRGPQVLNVRTN